MPELPEAETIARLIHARLVGRRLARVVHLRRDVVRHGGPGAPRWLAGARVEQVTRRGKRPVIELGGGRGIVVLLGMTGKLYVSPCDCPADRHVHLRVALDDGTEELRFDDYRRFGGLCFYAQDHGTVPAGLEDLGVEPLVMSLRQFRVLMIRRRQIKALLMDQAVIAGLGNIYCDEALHQARIHPLEIAAELTPQRVARLCRAIKCVLRAAIRYEGTTIINYASPDGPGHYQARLKVYGHEDEPCRRCRTPIVRVPIAGRSTHLCPRCQASPNGTG